MTIRNGWVRDAKIMIQGMINEKDLSIEESLAVLELVKFELFNAYRDWKRIKRECGQE